MTKLHTLMLMLCLTTISLGQSTMHTEKSQIKELIIKSFDDIWSELNSKNMDTYYTKDFLLLENGEVWNTDSISNYLDTAILKQPIPTRVNSFEFIEVRVLNGMAWVAYENRAVFTIENKIIRKAHWIESATAIKTENGWKLQMLHSTRAKND